jgi:arsenite methyltransferase
MSLDAHVSVKEYYGKVLESTKDLKTDACCTTDSLPKDHRAILSEIADEIKDKYYGCGLPIPPQLNCASVLDLGSGSGRDAYLLSRLVGSCGKVVGIDMTQEQLDVANKYRHEQATRFGYKSPNTEFKLGYIEDLKAAGIQDNSMDLVVSNCVINLSPDKRAVFSEIFRVLKAGGEMYISDVFSDRRIPEALRQDPILYGECISGALYIEDFRRILSDIGCHDYRIVSSRPLGINNDAIKEKVGNINFYSITVRAFKLDLEDKCEDYGQTALYNGTIDGLPHAFDLDDHHHLETGRPMLVCGNTADMLSKTRYAKHFTITGSKDKHFGLFNCEPSVNLIAETPGACC